MHTFGHTKRKPARASVPNTIQMHGSYYYNRRVPRHAVEAFGTHVRICLSSDAEEAALLSEGLTERLNGIWKLKENCIFVEPAELLESCHPRPCTLALLQEEYLALKRIDEGPLRLSVDTLISLAGDKDMREYSRRDARAFVEKLRRKGNSTGTIRRRIGPLSALFNYAYAELDEEKRNPFSQLHIRGEGDDERKRETFSVEELTQGYDMAFGSGSEIKMLMPILGETGCRIAEIVGLRMQDIDLENELIRVVPHPARRLKTSGSERELPLVGAAMKAMKSIATKKDGALLFPRYLKDGTIRATHASNALNKWMKREFDGKTAHCLRHTFRDRLREVECPLELIDELGGWSFVGGVGSRYGKGYALSQKQRWLSEISLCLTETT